LTQTSRPICDYEGSDYQERFWEHGDRLYEDQVEAIALRRLLPSRGESLLEVGAGTGRNTPRYSGFGRVVLVDYSTTQLQQAQSRLGCGERYLFVAANAYHLPFANGAFDAATMIRTLHHMADPPAALRQVRETLQPGATFILEYANKRNLKAIGRWLVGRQDWNPFSRQAVEFVPLNFDFHPAAVRDWLRSCDFQVVRQLTVSHFRLGVLKRLVPTRLLVGLDSLAQWTGGCWQLTPSVFVGARAVGHVGDHLPGAFWRCPACGSTELVETEAAVTCGGCRRAWPRQGGIYDFRVD
jgi:SAM-dependent methyltransferase